MFTVKAGKDSVRNRYQGLGYAWANRANLILKLTD